MPRRLAAAADDEGLALTKSRASLSTSIGCAAALAPFLSLLGRRWITCPPRGKAASGVAGVGRDLGALAAGALEFADFLRAIVPT